MYHRTIAIGSTRAQPSFPASRVGPMVFTSLRNVNLQGQRHQTSSGSKPVEKTVVKVTSKENVGFGQGMLKKAAPTTTMKITTKTISKRRRLRHVSAPRRKILYTRASDQQLNIGLGRRKLRRVTQRPQSKYPAQLNFVHAYVTRVKRRPTKRISQIKITAIDHGMGRVRRASKRIAPVLSFVTYRAPTTRMTVKPAAHHGPEVAITT
ncbi:hypothetical protein CHUAL_008009 [Chamberlinius hualienensis]